MTKKLVWRLGKLPSPDEVRELVKDKIITQDEAREILFSTEDTKERDENSLKSEIKFLRELVEKLSHGNTTRIIETIREVEKPYRKWYWHEPYTLWCDAVSGNTTLLNVSTNTANLADATNAVSFTSITT